MKKCYQCGKTEGKLVRVPHKTGWWCVEHAYAERQDAAEHGYSWPSTCPRCQGWSETVSYAASQPSLAPTCPDCHRITSEMADDAQSRLDALNAEKLPGMDSQAWEEHDRDDVRREELEAGVWRTSLSMGGE